MQKARPRASASSADSKTKAPRNNKKKMVIRMGCPPFSCLFHLRTQQAGGKAWARRDFNWNKMPMMGYRRHGSQAAGAAANKEVATATSFKNMNRNWMNCFAFVTCAPETPSANFSISRSITSKLA
jgi:hypothetical protein